MDLPHLRTTGRPYALSLARPLARQSVLVALLAVLFASALSLLPTRAEAYPTKPPACTASVSSQHVTSGTKITFHGQAEVPLRWVTTFDGKTKKHTGNTFDTQYVAPHVTSSRDYQLTVDGAFVDPADASAYDGPCHAQFSITVSPRRGEGTLPNTGNEDNNGALPNTGGPQLALLGVAMMLLLLGVASIRRARRSNEA